MVVVDGVSMCVAEAAEKYGQPISRVWGRIQNGWDVGSIFKSQKQEPSKLITVKGETLPFTEMARKYNIPIQRAYDRVYILGWNADDAFTLPKNTRLTPNGKTKC